MAIHTDSTPLNADIDIDFVKKKVSFSYPYDKTNPKTRISFIYLTVVQAFIILGIPIWFSAFLITSVISEMGKTFQIRVLTLIVFFLFIVIFMWLIPYVISLYINKNYDKYILSFPKFNAWFFGLISLKRKLLFRNIEAKQVEIPFFKNIVLEYEATEDYAEYLTDIKIKSYKFKRVVCNKIKPNYFIFKCIFLFKKVPKKGELFVKYI